MKPALGFRPPFAPRIEGMATLGPSVRTKKALVACFSQSPDCLTHFILPAFDTQTQNRVPESASYVTLETEMAFRGHMGPSLPVTNEAPKTWSNDSLDSKERACARASLHPDRAVCHCVGRDVTEESQTEGLTPVSVGVAW